MKPRLAIVVPYRNRESHLRTFVGHLQAYFARDKWDHDIPYRVMVVEQAPGQPFNAGALKDIGFQLTKDDSDYTCFHDVDYLPMWADYSWTDEPTVIVHYGPDERPLEPGRTDAFIEQDMEHYFSGAVMVPNPLVLRVNGFASDYWGWGYEDTDLRRRFERAGIPLGRRKGTFQSLEHQSRGYGGNGLETPIATVNKRLYDEKEKEAGAGIANGLSTLSYRVLRRIALPLNPNERTAPWEMVMVALDMQPRREQMAAVNPADL